MERLGVSKMQYDEFCETSQMFRLLGFETGGRDDRSSECRSRVETHRSYETNEFDCGAKHEVEYNGGYDTQDVE